jgi:predicted RNase H-like HicB family nuclease
MAKHQRQPKSLTSLAVEFDREVDGRWIAEIPALPGVIVYGATKPEALRNVYAVALRTLADSVEHGTVPASVSRLFACGVADR